MVLALDESRRAIDQQKSDLSEVRTVAGSLLGIGALSATFIGGLSIRDNAKVDGWTWLAVAAFAAMAVITAVISWPTKTTLEISGADIVAWAEQDSATEDEMTRDLALWLDKHRAKNRVTIERLTMGRSIVALLLLLLEIAALVLDLKSR